MGTRAEQEVSTRAGTMAEHEVSTRAGTRAEHEVSTRVGTRAEREVSTRVGTMPEHEVSTEAWLSLIVVRHVQTVRHKSRSIQLPVTVQGNKAKLWDSRPLAVKLMTKSDISINNGIFH